MSKTVADRKLFVDRKKALLDADVTQAQIARDAQVSGALVHQVLMGERKSARVLSALTSKLGAVIVAQLWPIAGPMTLAPVAASQISVAAE